MRVDKSWVKDVTLIPSPHFSSVSKFNVREELYEDKFVLSGFILHSLATEKELRNTLETALRINSPLHQLKTNSNLFALLKRRLSKYEARMR